MNGLINIRVEDKEPEVQATAQASDILHEEEETDKGSKVSKFFHFFFSIFLGSKEEKQEITLKVFHTEIAHNTTIDGIEKDETKTLPEKPLRRGNLYIPLRS